MKNQLCKVCTIPEITSLTYYEAIITADIVTPHDSPNEQYHGTIIFPKILNLPKLAFLFPGFLIVPL